jgi:hypothetical protein
VIFPGYTSSIACSCALQDRGAHPSSNSVQKCCYKPRTGLTITAILASFSLILTSTPQLRHPPARLLPPFTLTFSACLLIPSGLPIYLRVFQSRNRLIAGCKCLQSRPVPCVVCVLLSLPRPLSNLLHILVPPLALQTPLLP